MAPAPGNNVTVKGFSQWFCVSRSGRIDKRLHLTSVKTLLKKSFSGFERVTETALSDEFGNNVYTVGHPREVDIILITSFVMDQEHPVEARL